MAGLKNASSFRVFMTADAVGGVWQYSVDLADGLRSHGVDVTIAVLGPEPSLDQRKAVEDAGVHLVSTGLPLDWIAEAPSEIEAAGKALGHIASRAEPDIIHLNSPALAAGAAFPAPVVAVCHSCVATWWASVRSGSLPSEFIWRTDLVQRGYQEADLLLAPTHSFARATAATYGLEKPPLVVRNGRRERREGVEPSLGPFAITVGRLWDEGKNIAAIDRAAGRVSIPVLGIGPLMGPNGAAVQVQTIRAVGRLADEEIDRYLRMRPIFVSSARYEPFGLAVLEAAQRGCALVLSDIPTFRELWEEAALFVPPDDDREIARSIDHLIQDENLRSKLGQAAADRARSYTVEAMSTGVMNAYHSLLTSRRHRASAGEAAA